MMKIERERPGLRRAQPTETSSLESLLIDAWRRIDELSARVARLERVNLPPELEVGLSPAKAPLEQAIQLQRIAQWQREREKPTLPSQCSGLLQGASRPVSGSLLAGANDDRSLRIR